MTPKQKAQELVDKCIYEIFDLRDGYNLDEIFVAAKKCALIAVDEIINTDCLIDEDAYVMTPSYIQYWQEVKQEIENF
jgi:hypothetical protein